MGNAMSKPFVERDDYWFYTITCKDEDISDFYIGSTKKWDSRKSVHKSQCNNGIKKKVYRYINEYGGWDNWDMIEIGFQENLTSMEARIMEDILMEELGSTLNNNAAYRSYEKSLLYQTEYHEKHKHYSDKRAREKITCECGITISRGIIARHRKSDIHNKRLNEQK